MILRVFIRRIFILVIIILLMVNIGHRAFDFIKGDLLVEKGSAKIYLDTKDNPEKIKDKFLKNYEKDITLKSETEIVNRIDYYYVTRTIQSENLYDVNKRLAKVSQPVTVISDNGIKCVLRIGKKFPSFAEAKAEADKINSQTHLNTYAQQKNTTSKNNVNYFLIKNISMNRANKLAKQMPDYKIKWVPNPQ